MMTDRTALLSWRQVRHLVVMMTDKRPCCHDDRQDSLVVMTSEEPPLCIMVTARLRLLQCSNTGWMTHTLKDVCHTVKLYLKQCSHQDWWSEEHILADQLQCS